MSVLPTDPAAGDNLAGYQLHGLLRESTTGAVFRATDPSGKTVALKLLRGTFAEDAVARGRLEREALAGVLANHPNCVGVLDLQGLPDGRMFLVLEHVDGELLSDLVAREGRLEVVRALHIVRHILSGLAHAHDANIIHRSIEPANVVITGVDGDRDFARLMNFGVAKLEGSAGAGQEQLTTLGQTLGNPNYSPPEAISSGHVDRRADLYSVAAILYELLTGRPPFDDDDPVEVLRALASDPPPAFGPELAIPAPLEQVVRRGLAKSPEERFASARDFIAALEQSTIESADRSPREPSSAANTSGASHARFDRTVALGTLDPKIVPGLSKAADSAPAPSAPPLGPAMPQPPAVPEAATAPLTQAAGPAAPPPSWPAPTALGLRASLARLRHSPSFPWVVGVVFVFVVTALTALFTAAD